MESHSSEEEKSKNEEDDYEDESIYIKIKKEKPNMIYLEKKIYEKIILQIEKYNSIIKEIKSKSFNTESNLGLIQNNNNNIKNDKLDKILQEKEKTINELRNEIGLKEKEIISLKLQNEQINKKYDELNNRYNKEIEEKNIMINSIKEDLNNINNKYNDLIEKINEEKSKEDKTIFLIKILTNEKISDNIMKYLTLEESLKLFSVNKAINLTFKYKNKYNELQKKFSESQNLIAHLTSEDILKKYEIEDEELQKILKKYTNTHVISGNPLRISIFSCLTFLEKIIRKPLRELNFETLGSKGVISNKEKISQKAKGIFNNILSVVGKREDIEMRKLIKENLEQKLIEMNFEVYYNIQKKKEIEFKEKINSDQLINIKFEYNSADEIKYLIRHFLKVGLSENYYTQFKSYLIDEFAELLFNSYKSLECIKELEICNKIQGIRFNKNIYLIKQMTSEIDNLNKLKESNKQASNKLIQQKNELEIKYNDSLLMISSTNKQLLEANTQIQKLLEEKNKSEEELQMFKNKIMNEYKIIEDKYNKVNQERKSFINIFLEMKIFFINQIELLNKQGNNIN
jgi:hypothetical protein